MDAQELQAWLRLTLTPGIGNTTARKLLAAFGSAEAIFEQSSASLQQLGSDRLAGVLRAEPKNLAAQLHATLDWLQGAGDRRIVWKVGALPNVQGDPRLLRQVFVNLVGNAFKYTAGVDEAVIEVSATPAGPGEVCISVIDNGFGFDMTYADKLFGPFQRLHSDPRFEGTGIGLATVKRIVERHGGQVSGEGVPGKGAVFRVVLKTA